MQRILNISEPPLNSKSMGLKSLFANPLEESSSDGSACFGDGDGDGDEADQDVSIIRAPRKAPGAPGALGALAALEGAPRKGAPLVSAPDVRVYIEKTFEYYALDDEARAANKAVYQAGAQPMQNICQALYDSLIADDTWTPRAHALFTAIQFCSELTYSDLENDDTKRESQDALIDVDLCKRGKVSKLAKKNCACVHIVRSPLFHWERERELYEFDGQIADYTAADPGTLDEYSERFYSAAHLVDGSVAPVTVRKLEAGVCVTESVRPTESFVIENHNQQTFIQCLYEIFSWFIRLQGEPLSDWRKTANKEEFLAGESKKFLRKYELLMTLSSFELPPAPQKSTVQKSKKNMTAFDNFWAKEKEKGVPPAKTKKAFAEEWKSMSADEKLTYRTNPVSKRESNTQNAEVDTVDTVADAAAVDTVADDTVAAAATVDTVAETIDATIDTAAADNTVDGDAQAKTKKKRCRANSRTAPRGSQGADDGADHGAPSRGSVDSGASLLHSVYAWNMTRAIESGNFKRATPFDDEIAQAMELPEADRVAAARRKIMKKIADAPVETAEAWRDGFRVFNAMFGPVSVSEPAADFII